LFTVDSDGFVVFANKVSLENLGYTFVELDYRPFITLVSDDDRSLVLTNIFNVEISSTVKLSASLKKKNGELIAMTILATPIFDLAKQITAYSLIASPEIIPLQLKSNEATDVAAGKKITQDKGIDIEFLSNVFHEILTPMNVILGFVQEIVENIEKPTLEQKESIEIIEQNREVLLQTMNSLLEYSHLEQNKIEFATKKFLFTDIVESLQKRTQKIAKTRNIDFSYGKISSSLNIETDVQKLETFLVMFITIAMHITREKKIFLSAYQYNDEHFIVGVKDSRKSVSNYLAENLKNILTGVSYKKDFGVSRLTLKLSNKLREMLSGEFKYIERNNEIIEVGFIFPMVVAKPGKMQIKEAEIIVPEEIEETEPEFVAEDFESAAETIAAKFETQLKTSGEFERETTVREEVVETEIPSIKSIPEEKIEIKPEKTQEVKPKEKLNLADVNCLYVEDQVDSQILFKVQLKEAKKIDFAVSFEAALPLLQQYKYDFIVLDINLQGEYNGLDALRIIRKLPGYENSKIIAVTAYVLPGDKDKFIAAGFNDFISKPILREKLIDSLNKIMST
jgi:PAS domain S-box-containing protein